MGETGLLDQAADATRGCLNRRVVLRLGRPAGPQPQVASAKTRLRVHPWARRLNRSRCLIDTLAMSIAVTSSEICNIESSLPVTLGVRHPEADMVGSALAGVSGRLLTATGLAASGDEDGAKQIALTQLHALRSLRSTVATLEPAPRTPEEVLAKLDLVCGLLALATGLDPIID